MTQQATTPFSNTSAALVLGMGAAIVQVYDVTAQAASGVITLTFSQPITKGQLRVKSSLLNAATTVVTEKRSIPAWSDRSRCQSAW